MDDLNGFYITSCHTVQYYDDPRRVFVVRYKNKKDDCKTQAWELNNTKKKFIFEGCDTMRSIKNVVLNYMESH